MIDVGGKSAIVRCFHLATDHQTGNAAGHFVTNEMSFTYREQKASNALRDLLSLLSVFGAPWKEWIALVKLNHRVIMGKWPTKFPATSWRWPAANCNISVVYQRMDLKHNSIDSSLNALYKVFWVHSYQTKRLTATFNLKRVPVKVKNVVQGD